MTRERLIKISDLQELKKQFPPEKASKSPQGKRKSPKKERWDNMTQKGQKRLEKKRQKIDRAKSDQKKFMDLKESGKLKELIENKEAKKKDYLKKEQAIIDKLMSALLKQNIEKEKLEKEAAEEEMEEILKNNKTMDTQLKQNIETRKLEKETIEEEIAEILKNNKINQIIVGGEKTKDKNGEKITGFKPDLDALTALYLLDNYNEKEKDTYGDRSVVTIINKDNTGQNKIPNKDGLTIFLDVGGTWMQVEKNGEATTLHLDHHGSGKGEKTSGTKMVFDLLNKGKILKDVPEWLKKFVNSVNEIDNLSYLDKKDNKKRKIFNESYFRNEWPNSFLALAEKDIPFKKLIELCESKTIKDPSVPFTKEELEGKLGKTKIGEKTIAELCNEKKEQVKKTIRSIKNSEKHLSKMDIDTKNTVLGDIVYHNFPEMEYANGKKFINTIPEKLDFIGTKALGKDTFISWNEEKGSFFIDSFHPNLDKIIKTLNEKDPGCAIDVRGNMVFGKINKLTEEEFLNIIDPKILKNSKIMNSEKSSEKNEVVWTEENEKERQKLIEEIEKLKNEISGLDTEIEKLKNTEEIEDVSEINTTEDETISELTIPEPNVDVKEVITEDKNTESVNHENIKNETRDTSDENELEEKSYSFEEIIDDVKQYISGQENVKEVSNLKVAYRDNQITISGNIEMNLIINGKDKTDKINLIKLTLVNKDETIKLLEISTLTGYADSLTQNPRVIEMKKIIEDMPNIIIKSIEEKEGRKIKKITIEGKELIVL